MQHRAISKGNNRLLNPSSELKVTNATKSSKEFKTAYKPPKTQLGRGVVDTSDSFTNKLPEPSQEVGGSHNI